MCAQPEAADRSLTTLVIPVEEEDREAPLLAAQGRLHRSAVAVLGAAHARLPEARVRRRDVQIPQLLAELVELRVDLQTLPAPPAYHMPAVQNRHAGADVTERNRHRDVVSIVLDAGKPVARHEDLS